MSAETITPARWGWRLTPFRQPHFVRNSNRTCQHFAPRVRAIQPEPARPQSLRFPATRERARATQERRDQRRARPKRARRRSRFNTLTRTTSGLSHRRECRGNSRGVSPGIDRHSVRPKFHRWIGRKETQRAQNRNLNTDDAASRLHFTGERLGGLEFVVLSRQVSTGRPSHHAAGTTAPTSITLSPARRRRPCRSRQGT